MGGRCFWGDRPWHQSAAQIAPLPPTGRTRVGLECHSGIPHMNLALTERGLRDGVGRSVYVECYKRRGELIMTGGAAVNIADLDDVRHGIGSAHPRGLASDRWRES